MVCRTGTNLGPVHRAYNYSPHGFQANSTIASTPYWHIFIALIPSDLSRCHVSRTPSVYCGLLDTQRAGIIPKLNSSWERYCDRRPPIGWHCTGGEPYYSESPIVFSASSQDRRGGGVVKSMVPLASPELGEVGCHVRSC